MDPPSTAVPYARLELPDLDSVPSYKYWSIFNILCCCLPLGLVAVYYSGQVEECLARRDTAGAKTASDTARKINILAVVIGLACIGVAIFFMIQRAELIKAAQPTQFPLYYNLG
ncbi:interferon-induced transmembrane protein 1-like [Macrochelys suwanniensis]